MAFWIASSPHNHIQAKTPALMRLVIFATLPGILAQWYFFGWGNLLQIALAVSFCVLTEITFLAIRDKNIKAQISDYSAVLTGVLIGISIPAFAPWWIAAIGSVFAIAVVKQLYGGLGYNLFNPAMAAYVLLLVSFPVHMTAWAPVSDLMTQPVGLFDTLWLIFTGFSSDGFSVEQIRMNIDGITMATPLDTLKTDIGRGLTVKESFNNPVFGEFVSHGWEWVNLGFLIGGLYLIAKKAIDWRLPVSFLTGLLVFTFIGYVVSPDSSASTMFHWLSGGTMLGAFFIITDPVSGSTTAKGRIVFALLIALLVAVIRKFGGYPDAIAFAVLLANMAVPLIDQYTRPRTYGHKQGGTS
ncbi:electron transport complex subunit RsxD [Thalassotalea mangrovi]|uniref:Ion-translocating oxidoreductase complex subunit D n=1 Tax=Thalassotalea mangrovi TaxID=2572245 RepID=A0A4U1B1M3_9GAMM|nr:electron transport complex subunit RsxD [Thalassotalea mangrovi]TKB43153.1 electron transport complex subunit RsxD [Thalassotalea mangrovi]